MTCRGVGLIDEHAGLILQNFMPAQRCHSGVATRRPYGARHTGPQERQQHQGCRSSAWCRVPKSPFSCAGQGRIPQWYNARQGGMACSPLQHVTGNELGRGYWSATSMQGSGVVDRVGYLLCSKVSERRMGRGRDDSDTGRRLSGPEGGDVIRACWPRARHVTCVQRPRLFFFTSPSLPKRRRFFFTSPSLLLGCCSRPFSLCSLSILREHDDHVPSERMFHEQNQWARGPT
jgi:hypothetical protein